jgi:hypothetical protein
MSHIYLLSPTRGRPERLERMMASAIEMADDPAGLTFLVGYDRDDQTPRTTHQNAIVTELPTQGLGAHCKVLPTLYAREPDDVILVGTDDQVFDQSGWDRRIREVAADRRDPWLYYVDDTVNGERLSTIAFMTKRTVDLLGGWHEPWLDIYGDLWLWNLFHLFEPARVSYVSDVRIRHLRDGVETDETFREKRERIFAAIRRYGPDAATRQRDALITAIRRAEGDVGVAASAWKDGLTMTVGLDGRVDVTVQWYDYSIGGWRD